MRTPILKRPKEQFLATHLFPYFSLLHKSLVSSNSFKIVYLKNRTSINYKNYMGVLKISSSIIREVIRYTFDDFFNSEGGARAAKGEARKVDHPITDHPYDLSPPMTYHPTSYPLLISLRSTTDKVEDPLNGVVVGLRATHIPSPSVSTHNP